MKSKLLTCLLVLFLGSSLTALAQTKTVTGTVKDQSGLGVIGASIQEKGTKNGTITDLDGNYSITVKDNAVLVFTSIGYGFR